MWGIASRCAIQDAVASLRDYRHQPSIDANATPARVLWGCERMRQLTLNRADKRVYLRGDGAVNLQELYEVFDRLREAGIQDVGIISRLPEEQ